MATQTEVWVAIDGSYWKTESQCLAYEMKLYLINLGKSAQAIQVDLDGKIDEAGMNALAGFALSALSNTSSALDSTIKAQAVAAQQVSG